MDKYITNLESDILSIKDFEAEMLADKARGYDVVSLDSQISKDRCNRFRFLFI